jgi:hypothetical protein
MDHDQTGSGANDWTVSPDFPFCMRPLIEEDHEVGLTLKDRDATG